MYEMKPEYYTGIAQIDEEHKKLFEIADEAYELYKNEFIPDKRGTCSSHRSDGETLSQLSFMP